MNLRQAATSMSLAYTLTALLNWHLLDPDAPQRSRHQLTRALLRTLQTITGIIAVLLITTLATIALTIGLTLLPLISLALCTHAITTHPWGRT